MIEKIKLELKIQLTKSISDAFEEIENMLDTSSSQYNTFILLKSRLLELSVKDIKGIISSEERNLEMNQIRFSAIQFIDLINESDISKSENQKNKLIHINAIPNKEEEKTRAYVKYSKYINKLPDQERTNRQIKYTTLRLNHLQINPLQLKSNLKTAGHYSGDTTNSIIDKEVIDAIIRFQSSENILPVDGIYGTMTHRALLKLIR